MKGSPLHPVAVVVVVVVGMQAAIQEIVFYPAAKIY